MGRILFAIACWSLAIYVAASHYALAVAVPLGALLLPFILKFLHAGFSLHTALIVIAVIWTVGVIDLIVQGALMFARNDVERAISRWTWSVSMIGAALTLTVAVESAKSSWDYINGGVDAVENAG